ncbi:MAG TPA: prepilin-type N-terminal cleavage/methylation domain-containing protein [Patescibacteria group bacterium]|nr:prepilin-type N-terminal cleavage/methylation domain-containing protein [Patescibacteria group bacterium]
MRNQTGQTLIETIVAIFILTTALTAGLALTIYVFSNSQSSISSIAATNLARQGVEIVRNMRDSNWLQADKANTSAGKLQACSGLGSVLCYPQAYHENNNDNMIIRLNSTDTNTYTNSSTHPCSGNLCKNLNWSMSLNSWPQLSPFSAASSTGISPTASGKYNVYLHPDGVYYNETNPSGLPCSPNCVPDFIRKIKLTKTTGGIFPSDGNCTTSKTDCYGLKVQVYVAWSSKHCPSITDQDPEKLNTSCKVVLEEDLTNWKDY